tara:strand:- start:829 stop:1050 length:222 start_codon:yes stop_codon:yes gene_type:complete
MTNENKELYGLTWLIILAIIFVRFLVLESIEIVKESKRVKTSIIDLTPKDVLSGDVFVTAYNNYELIIENNGK